MKSYDDPALGELERRRGRWRRDMELGFETVPLVLAGGRSGPDPQAVAVARASVGRLPAWRELVGPALEEHRDAPFTWDEVISAYVFAGKDGLVEWGLRVAWDEEHTLGARMRDGELVELNGSVLAP
jgi:hypothetical protein